MRATIGILVAILLLGTGLSLAANHREAPITALDRLADITDYLAFVSYDDPDRVTLILAVDSSDERGCRRRRRRLDQHLDLADLLRQAGPSWACPAGSARGAGCGSWGTMIQAIR